VLRRWRHRWNKSPTLLQYQQVTSCINIAVRCREQKPEDRPSIGDIMSILSESVSTDWHTGQESTYLDDDILGIEPLELQFSLMLNTEMSCSVKLTNKTKACFAFNIERPSQQYTIQPDKGIVPPEWNEFLVKITLQPQDRAPEVTGNADKFTVQSTKVSEGLRVEDITERIFHEEAGKVVDEVDLMVVYGKGSGRRGPVCPFVEGVSVKPCQAINSISYEDGTRGQLGRRNFRPPKNFSRTQPANMTYLLRVSDRAIDVTRGAMGCLLHKLGELLKDFNLETSVKEDVDSHSKELVKMQLVLCKVSQVQQDNLDDLVKRWASNVREMSYDLEDFVDGFLVQSEPESNTSGFRELTHEMCFLLEKGKGHQPIGDLIKHHISKQVQDEAKKCKEYNVDNVVDDASATVTDTIDPRNLVVFQRPKELVGIEEPRDNLIKRLSQVSEQQLRIFSIYGAGGSGKTTLAKAVYDKLEGQFHPMAFVSVGRNPDKKQVLQDIIDELSNDSNTATLNEKQLIKELHKLLKNKRYAPVYSLAVVMGVQFFFESTQIVYQFFSAKSIWRTC
ncbi:uncharacterized protein LOC119345257, partial [Triticum dicoccoides]|uniref:uncharacterized protein LOC119345257 n=1 Tax=Triticum dicoccoides TaxID=85692 RepID=UPI00188E3BA7